MQNYCRPKQGCVTVGRPKFRKAKSFKSKTKQGNRRKVARNVRTKSAKKANPLPEKREKKAKELQWSFANCLRRSAVKISVGKFLSKKNLQKKSTQKCIKLISWLRLVCKNSWWDLGMVKCTFACPLEMFVNMCQFTTKIEKPGTSVYCVVITNTQQWSGRLTSTKPRSIFCNYRRLLCAPPWYRYVSGKQICRQNRQKVTNLLCWLFVNKITKV